MGHVGLDPVIDENEFGPFKYIISMTEKDIFNLFTDSSESTVASSSAIIILRLTHIQKSKNKPSEQLLQD